MPTQLACFGKAATIVGTEGNDRLRGTAGDDVIVGLGGDDFADAGESGTDAICGGAGRDILIGGPHSDEIDGGPDGDGVTGDGAEEFGPQGNDRLIGGDGQDLITYFVNPAGVEVNLATGVAAGAGADTIAGFEAISGSPHADLLVGDDAFNIFFPDVVETVPQGSADVIRGGGGIDIVAFQSAVRASLATRDGRG